MVKRRDADLDSLFGALADPTRRAILRSLADGERSVTELAEPFAMSLPAFSKHIGVLARAGLVRHRKTGRRRTCRLNAAPLRAADRWMEPYRVFWNARFDALAAYLRER